VPVQKAKPQAKPAKPVATKPAKAAAPVATKPVTAKPAPSPVKTANQSPPPKPMTQKTPAPKPAPSASQSGLSWSESIRKAAQDKSGQTTGPEHDKSDWKNRQRSGLSIAHRNKFG
jgi:hypothetical protein